MDPLPDMTFLSPEERNLILSVLQRDEELRHGQQNRASEIKQEVQELRMKSALRNGDDLSKICARCKTPFGFLFNTGDLCPVCRFRVCKDCRETRLDSQGWMCSLCFKENQLRWLASETPTKKKTGEETPHPGTPHALSPPSSLRDQPSSRSTSPNTLYTGDRDIREAQHEERAEEEEKGEGRKQRGPEEEDLGGDSAYSSAGSVALCLHTDHCTCGDSEAKLNSGRSDRCSTPDHAVLESLDGRPVMGPMDSLDDVESITEPDGINDPDRLREPTAAEDVKEDVMDSQNTNQTSNPQHEEDDDTDPGNDSYDSSFGSGKADINSSETEFSDESNQENETAPEQVLSPPVEKDDTAVQPSQKNVPTLEEQMAEVQKMRNPENMTYTMQRFFQADDAGSDTLSIISERTEPEDSETKTEKEYTMYTDEDSDSEGTVHDDLDGQWSDDSDDVIDAGAATPRRQSVVEVNETEFRLLQQKQANDTPQREPESDFETPPESDHAQASHINGYASENNDDFSDSTQASSLPVDPSVEDSSVQTDPLEPLQGKASDPQTPEKSEAELSCRSISSEDSSTQTEDVLFISKEEQDLFHDLLMQQEAEKPALRRSYSEDWTQTEPSRAEEEDVQNLKLQDLEMTSASRNLTSATDDDSLASDDTMTEQERGKVNTNSADICMPNNSNFGPVESHCNITVVVTTGDGHTLSDSLVDRTDATTEDTVQIETAGPAHPTYATTINEVVQIETAEPAYPTHATAINVVLLDKDELCALDVNNSSNPNTASNDDNAYTEENDQHSGEVVKNSRDPHRSADIDGRAEDEPENPAESARTPSPHYPHHFPLGLQTADSEQAVKTATPDVSETSQIVIEREKFSIEENFRDPSIEYVPEANMDLDDFAASPTAFASGDPQSDLVLPKGMGDLAASATPLVSEDSQNCQMLLNGPDDFADSVTPNVSDDPQDDLVLSKDLNDFAANVIPPDLEDQQNDLVLSKDLDLAATSTPVSEEPQDDQVSPKDLDDFASSAAPLVSEDPYNAHVLSVDLEDASATPVISEDPHNAHVLSVDLEDASAKHPVLEDPQDDQVSPKDLDNLAPSATPVVSEDPQNAHVLSMDVEDASATPVISEDPHHAHVLSVDVEDASSVRPVSEDLQNAHVLSMDLENATATCPVSEAPQDDQILPEEAGEWESESGQEAEVSSLASGGQLSASGSTGGASLSSGSTLLALVLLGAHEAERRRALTPDQSQSSERDHVDGGDQLEEAGALSRDQRSNSMGDLLADSPQASRLPYKRRAFTGSVDQLNHDDDDGSVSRYRKKGKSLSRSRFSLAASRESLNSVYSAAGEINYGRIPVSGDITFGLVYDQKQSVLNINIKDCQDLAPVDTKHNRSDPYVKAYLLPDKTRSGKRKSKIKKHTLNPVYNETLSYHISPGELETRTLWVTVWHSDRFGRNDFLGEVNIPMDMELFEDTTPQTYTLQSRMMSDGLSEVSMQYKGELILSLMYVTADKALAAREEAPKKAKSRSKKSKMAATGAPLGEVHVMVKSAKHLMAVRSSGSSDPFVKGYLLPERSRARKQKTPVVKNSLNPMWNHILVFEGVDEAELAEHSLELTIWDHEKLGTNQFLGGTRLNLGLGVAKGEQQVDWMDGKGEECGVWQDMMDRPDTWVDAVIPLRATMGRPNTKK